MIDILQIFKPLIQFLPLFLFIFLLIIFKDRINKYIRKLKNNKNNKKGAEYEKIVAKYYESKSYLIDERGLKKGYEDGGIDLIGFGHNKILLIQCKNWNHNNSFKVGEKEVREFYGACNFYIDDNNLSDKNIICIYAIPNKELLTNRAVNLFKKHYDKCRYEIIANKG